MRRLALVTVGLAFCVFPIFSAGQERVGKTGVELLKDCQSASNPQPDMDSVFGASYCIGYLRALVDAFSFWDYERKGNPKFRPPACVPAEATNRELAMVIVKYLNDHPSELHRIYSVNAMGALMNAYPCSKTSQ